MPPVPRVPARLPDPQDAARRSSTAPEAIPAAGALGGAAPVKNSAARRRSDYYGFSPCLRHVTAKRSTGGAGGRLVAHLCSARTTDQSLRTITGGRLQGAPADVYRSSRQKTRPPARKPPSAPGSRRWKTNRSFNETMHENCQTVAQAIKSDLPAFPSRTGQCAMRPARRRLPRSNDAPASEPRFTRLWKASRQQCPPTPS
jgi:hypothetical protein